MLELTILGQEHYNNETQEFEYPDKVMLQLEHSLVSLSLWESKWERSFLESDDKTTEQIRDYVRCMTLDPNIAPEVYQHLSSDNFESINTYINAKMTATFFHDVSEAPKSKEVITAEVIYYWLTAFQIPFEVETWHLNRLFTLIKICNIKNAKPKKMGRAEAAQRRQELNAQRRAKIGSTG